MITLQVLLAKIALHWRWIILVVRRKTPAALQLPQKPAVVQVTSVSDAQQSRRKYLQVSLAVAAIALFDISQLSKALGQTNTVQASGETSTTTSSQAATQTISNESAAQVSSTGNPAATLNPTETTQPLIVNTLSTCVVRCDKHCTFPGRCRRYIDSNRNGLCDNGECI